MRSYLKPLYILFSIFLLIPNPASAAQYTVTKIIDGDSIVAEGTSIIEVSLICIDAPELSLEQGTKRQPYSQEAIKFLINLVLNKVVVIKDYGLDGDTCVLAEVFIDGKSVNLEVVKNGFAEVCYDKPPEGINVIYYLAAEREAREELKGMWSLGDKYISPREWRKNH